MKFLKRNEKIRFYSWRFYLIASLLCLCFLGLTARIIDLTIFDRDFLQEQGNARALRIVKTPAYRGMITDRSGIPLAISTPMDSVWINPKEFVASDENIAQLHQLLGFSLKKLHGLLLKNKDREFVYLKRSISPELAKKITDKHIPGIYLQTEYRRYYPDAAVTSHILGFTNVDDHGQEGLELAYDKWLSGKPGKQSVVKDRMGHIVKQLNQLQQQVPGHNLVLSIDQNIQFLAYQTLKNTVDEFDAKAGSVVVLDTKTGEILAMVNQPDYNPNNRADYVSANSRNRAVTDTFEPGSTMKTFAVVSALDSKKYTPDTVIDTNPGWMMVGRARVSDEEHNYGKISLTEVLQKSSNVGITKATLSLPPEQLRGLLSRVGFSHKTDSGFPGESEGYLVDYKRWPQISLSTLAFGYGLRVTPLQLASAYSIIANNGIKKSISLLKTDKPLKSERVLDSKVAQSVLGMLESVISKEGTGGQAKVRGYRVAGKTGTARVAVPGGYDKHRHVSSFVGIAPATHPRVVVAVVIFEPRKKHYYGGLVAAPAFSKIMAGTLRILKVPPDDLESFKHVLASKQGVK